MEVIVLGTSGAYPGPGRAASGYLVRHDGFNLVLDLGQGSLANLQRHIAFHEIDGVAVSHEHPDHCLDLYSLWMAKFFHPEDLPPTPLVAPAGVFDRAAAVHRDQDGVNDMRTRFDLRQVEPGSSFELGPFRVETRPMAHLVATLGMRIEAGGQVLAYSGDTGPTDELVSLSRDADVLVVESSWLDGQERGDFHMTARWGGEHAARAGVGHLVLSHFWPTNPRDPSREQAGEAFVGRLTLADEGMRLEVSS